MRQTVIFELKQRGDGQGGRNVRVGVYPAGIEK